jgi:hypothetical protein
MPHAYDTGLLVSQRAAIRDALIARLAPLKKTAAVPGYIPANGIKTLPRPLRGQGDEDGLGMLAEVLKHQAPAIVIALGRLSYESGGGEAIEARAELEIAIYIASGHQHALDAGRLYGGALAAASNTNDPGIFTMLEHVRERVLGQSLGIVGVDVPRAVEEDEVFTGDDATIWEQRYTLALDVQINPFRAITQTVTEIEGLHKLKPDIPDGHTHDPLVTTLADLEP